MTKFIGISASIVKDEGRKRFRVDHAYIDSILNAGALPLMIPVYENVENLRALVSEMDALILAGGADVSPFLYGEDPLTEEEFQPDRDKSEMELYRLATEKGIPIMGICRGLQLVNVIKGGSLYQDLRKFKFEKVHHNRIKVADEGPDEMYHFINIDRKSRFYKYSGSEQIVVNSIHHQAIKDLGLGLKATAFSRDGIIEIVEDENYPNFWGFQFHPERLSEDEIFNNIFKDFLRSADD
ncbi:MAG: gamma-glutamyl-gamma-aminobutyrate hydrolase family protein [Tissierellia bacterium]|nr:gamma-glutamyl-gamma-aminobutyrate hydrolase family protein [Tissierellia bacterium]